PFWEGKTQRDRLFSILPRDWKLLYESCLFTEFAEQRAYGHTALDGKIYHTGMNDFRERIALALAALKSEEVAPAGKADTPVRESNVSERKDMLQAM
ncbi:MAG TPA: hypothetical protein DDW70_08315, partial [Rikenellaceae bacterium]|nr:hypothetical protein [Rikenellaceae bacterium]